MKWCRVKAFIVKDVKSMLRDKAVLFWIFMWPIVWILMTAYVFIPPGTGSPITLDLGVVNRDSSQAPFNGASLIDILNRAEYNGTRLFNVKIYESEEDLVNDLRRGRLDAGVIVPEGFGRDITNGQGHVDVLIGAKNPYSSQVGRAIIESFIHELNRRIALAKINITSKYIYVPILGNNSVESYLTGIVEPIDVSIRDVRPEAIASRPALIGWYTIGAIGMMFLYGGFSFGALMVVEERERGVLKRILSTPAGETDLLVGKTLSSLLILGLSSIIALLTGVFVCDARIVWSPLKLIYWLIPLLVTFTALMSIGMGVVLSLFTRSVKGANSLATILGLMLAFTAGIWFPSQMLPQWMQVLAKIFPVTWAIETMRSIMVFNASFKDIWVDMVRIAVATIAIYTVAALTYKMLIRKYAEA